MERGGQSDVIGERLNQPLLALNMEGGQEPRNVCSLPFQGSRKRQENRFSLKESRKEYSPAGILILVQGKPFENLDHYNFKISLFVLFKPLSLCYRNNRSLNTEAKEGF